jgi:ppGpp synthetase/RelA/SpoT-type nucleotidyltranferase
MRISGGRGFSPDIWLGLRRAFKGNNIVDESLLEVNDEADQEVLIAMAWAKPQFSKGRVDWAGEVLSKDIGPDTDWDEFDLAVNIVNNWRSVHSYPLQAMKMTLKRRAKRICASAIVAQRLKRLASIKLKLNLSRDAGQHPNLSQMQDIGGCRAIMESVSQVRELEVTFSEASKKNPHRGPQYYKTSDYITTPKDNGYRGVHLIYRFRSDSAQHSCYNGQRIEIQLRTRLQHFWATAVETYSTFSGEALKSNIGSDEWKRFFALVSSVIAIDEGQPTTPSTPVSLKEIVPEMRGLYVSLNVKNVLSGWAAITKFTAEDAHEEIRDAGMYLLVLDPNTFSTSLYPYSKDHLAQANTHYAKIEKEEPNLQAVLVSVDSLAALRTAYPNYFLDTTAFLEVVEGAIGKESENT